MNLTELEEKHIKERRFIAKQLELVALIRILKENDTTLNIIREDITKYLKLVQKELKD